MKIEDIGGVIEKFLTQKDSYTTILIDGRWGCGKTTQVHKTIDKIKNKDIIYISLFGIKSLNELSACFTNIGKGIKTAGAVISTGTSLIPLVGPAISSGLSNVLDKYDDKKIIKRKKVFIFDDLERIDKDMSLISLLGFFNKLTMKDCRILCLSSLKEINDEKKRNDFNRFIEKAFDRVYHIDESALSIFEKIFKPFELNNVAEISQGFDDNIRLAKRASILLKNADDYVERIKDKGHDFYKNYSKELLFNASMLAIVILYTSFDIKIPNEKNDQSYSYLFYQCYTERFDKGTSDKYVTVFLNKTHIYFPEKISSLASLTKCLMLIEMFEDYSALEEESRVVVVDNEADPLFVGSFYYLNDADRKKCFDRIVDLVSSNKVRIDSALISKIGEISMYSSFAFKEDFIDKIANSLVEQVLNNNNEAYEKAKGYDAFTRGKGYENVNYVELIYKKAKNKLDESLVDETKNRILSAFKASDYSTLTNIYYDFAEGKKIMQKDKYIAFTEENNYFFPHLEESFSVSAWSFCHQMARYAVATKTSDKFIDYLKEYCKKYPNEESLLDKAHSLIIYNIDGGFDIEELKPKNKTK